MKDLIIGAADNYDWPHIKIWARSLTESGFTGDVVLIAYRVTNELVNQCKNIGIQVFGAEIDELGRPIDHDYLGLPTQSHRMRNFHIWQYLHFNSGAYRFVAVTDTRDVCFQSNPSVYFDTLANRDNFVAMPSEAITFEYEPWNGSMVRNLFGEFIYDLLKNKSACNSGTFFGRQETITPMLLNMYLVAKHFNTTGTDQPTMNVLGYLFYGNVVSCWAMENGWACQAGTVLDPSKSHFQIHLNEPIPIIRENGIVTPFNSNTPFVILHQYDRVPQLKQLIEARYA